MSGFNINDIFQCAIVGAGIPFDMIALGIFAMFVLFAAISRLDFDLSLGFALALTWALQIISGNSSFLLQYLMNLLLVGLGIRILVGIIGIFRQ